MHLIKLFVALLLSSYAVSQTPDESIILGNDETAEITSPNYPNDYGNNKDKLWKIVAPDGYRIGLDFTDFSTEEGYDFVIIYDGTSGSFDEATDRVRFSGNTLPLNVTSASRYMWIRFTSDWRDQYPGFRAIAYLTIPPDWACDFFTNNCGLISDESWSTGKVGNFYYIQASGSNSSFKIPHAFTSSKGTLSFAHYQRDAGSLSVAVCKSEQARSYSITHPYIISESIRYSCNGIQDLEITFTATRRNTNTRIRVLDIQLFETSVPSTAVPSTTNSDSDRSGSITTTHGPMTKSISMPETHTSQSSSLTRTTMPVSAQASRGVLNSAVIPTVSSVLVLLVVGLVVVALFVYRRRRSRVPKTTGPVDQNDDDRSLYNNPVYDSKDEDDSIPDLLVGISSPDPRNDTVKGEPSAHHNPSSAATQEKETSNLSSYYSVHYPSKRDVNKEAKSKNYEDGDNAYENADGKQSYKDPKKVSTGKPKTNKASKTLSSITSQGRGKPDTEQNSGKKRSPDSTAVLADDEEYNALTFNQSADITRALKKPNAGGVNVTDGYGVLDLPEEKSTTLQPKSQELHNDDVYSSLDEPPQEHHRGKQEIKGPRSNPKPNKTNQPDSESEYHNYQDPNQMDQDRPDLGESQEPDAISDDHYDILQSGKQVGDQHVFQQKDDAEVDQGYYVNLGASVGNEDEYSTIDQGPIHKLGESEAHGFEPIYSDEVYSEFN